METDKDRECLSRWREQRFDAVAWQSLARSRLFQANVIVLGAGVLREHQMMKQPALARDTHFHSEDIHHTDTRALDKGRQMQQAMGSREHSSREAV